MMVGESLVYPSHGRGTYDLWVALLSNWEGYVVSCACLELQPQWRLFGDTQTQLCECLPAWTPSTGWSTKENAGGSRVLPLRYVTRFQWPSPLHRDRPLSEQDFLSYLSRSLADRWGTTADFTTSFLHSSRFSAFRSMIFHSRPVHSLMLSSHRFLCLPLRLPPWTVHCRIVLASPDDRATCPYHFSLSLFIEVRRFSYDPMAFLILAFTSSFVMWSLYEIQRSLRKHLMSSDCIQQDWKRPSLPRTLAQETSGSFHNLWRIQYENSWCTCNQT